jgi:hypothetical protein
VPRVLAAFKAALLQLPMRWRTSYLQGCLAAACSSDSAPYRWSLDISSPPIDGVSKR